MQEMATEFNVLFLVSLIFFHLISDFMFQPTYWVKDRYQNKWYSKYLYYHGLIAGILAGIPTFFLFGTVNSILVIISVSITHILIDGFKTKFKDNLLSFMGDQFAHIVVLIVIWIAYTQPNFTNILEIFPTIPYIQIFIVFIAYMIILRPSGIVIGYIIKIWKIEPDDDNVSLENAGRRIGYLERFLILTLILLQQYTAIGFLVAAKSIFRFDSGKSRPIGEYVLFGTLLSFSIAIALGLITFFLINIVPS
jgi:hypothetical protein